MATIEGFRVRNFGVLRDVALGRVWDLHAMPLTPLTAVVAKNGGGKSTLFDAFGFLADCLKVGVEEACDARGRGGFDRILSRGRDGESIRFDVSYKAHGDACPMIYELEIAVDASRRPYVAKERLRQGGKGVAAGQPFDFLMLGEGQGGARRGGEGSCEEFVEVEAVHLENKRQLGIAILGALKRYPRISAFRRFIEGWYLSCFTPDAARGLPLAGPQARLNIHGDNLGNVVQFMKREHPARFKGILSKIAAKIPGVETIATEKTPDGRLLLKFNDRGFEDPFYAQQMSDGTLKVFAYLLLLEDPTPPPFLCIEEPENGLYHKLLATLADEFRTHAAGRDPKRRSQVFVTTHQPYFVDALTPEEVWILEKGEDGFSQVRRASDDPLVKNLVEEGLPLGGLWFSDYLEG